MQKSEGKAAELDDGTKVFRDVQGNIITENEKVLSAEDAQNIHIPDDAPIWEEYKAARDETERLRSEREEIERFYFRFLEH